MVENRAEDKEVGAWGPFGRTLEEDQLLRQEVLAGTPLDVIAGQLGRTKPAIRTRAYTLRLMLGWSGTNRSAAVMSFRANKLRKRRSPER